MKTDNPRILFFSDSHGVFAALQALRKRIDADAPDLACFLGDALYHGPRNGVPQDYDGARAAEEFNAIADKIVAVRGNCDAEIDQLMLSFPMLDLMPPFRWEASGCSSRMATSGGRTSSCRRFRQGRLSQRGIRMCQSQGR